MLRELICFEWRGRKEFKNLRIYTENAESTEGTEKKGRKEKKGEK
jgi:hypothetical protein